MTSYVPYVALLLSTSALAEPVVSARAGHFSECKIVSTETAGEARVRFEVLGAEEDPEWHPHFGLTLTDADDYTVYKISVLAFPEPLRVGQAQQMFSFRKGSKEPMHAINVLASHTPSQDGKVEFRMTWDEKGLFLATVDGVKTGWISSSRTHQALNIFVSGATVRVDAGDVDLSQCHP
ncbi:MAG: hypothetical protein EKK53_23415 [Burkholderiales bacterium]|nr:MAG: hypothetical protein EKK53_23415 [Burkholderiales bacterium]